MNEWISVKDRMPDEEETVVVWKNGELDVFTYEGNNKWWDYEGWSTTEGFGVSHWMRISEPPKEEI